MNADMRARIAAVWVAAAALEMAVSLLVPGTSVRAAELSLGIRLSLVVTNLALLTISVAAAGGAASLIRRWRRAVPHRTAGGIAIGAGYATLWLVVLAWIASWALFWNLGVFLDREGVRFWAMNPVQMLHWVYPPMAVSLLAATSVVAFVLAWLIPRLVDRLTPRRRSRLARIAGGTAALVVLGAVVVHVIEPAEVLPGGRRSAYAIARDEHTGPLLHAWADLLRPSAAFDVASTPTDPSARIVRRPIVSMDEYLRGASPRQRWNVVMIQIESLRADQLRAYGGSRDVMPTIDALARESRVYTDAYIQASHSNYADLVPLSSQYPLRSPEMTVYPPNPPYPRVLVYDVLKGLGYKTGIFSSQNERWGGMLNFHRLSNVDCFFDPETFSGPTYTPWQDEGFAEWVRQTRAAGSVDDRYTVGAAIDWIDTIGPDPFFIHVNLQSSHLPYVVPPDFTRPFGPQQLDFTILWGRFPRERLAAVKDRYADSLNYEDLQVARLFQHLRQRGLWDRTLVIVGGDNGEAFYEHGFASHASWLFNEVVKVPMIVRAPGLAEGVDARPAMFLDVPPTILDLLGLPPHPGFQGISLVQPRIDPARPLFMIAQTPAAYETAMVRSSLKLHFAERERRYFLFDLAADPGELNDIADQRPDVVRALASRLLTWRREQLEYYADASRQRTEYPPVIED